ncbi:MAG: hypothetical protein CMK59_13270 [Proteobacteria bacterium]|nr:hypothetical protein [Pseudomonadota bacterium]
MSINKLFASAIMCFAFTGCAQAPDQQNFEALSEQPASETPLRQHIQSNVEQPIEELSCLEQCGKEARGTVYADCLTQGGEQQECGHQGRLWYRECLESRCGEEALQQDDCRIECRFNSKEQYAQCVSETGDSNDCRAQTGSNVRECIQECQ